MPKRKSGGGAADAKPKALKKCKEEIKDKEATEYTLDSAKPLMNFFREWLWLAKSLMVLSQPIQGFRFVCH